MRIVFQALYYPPEVGGMESHVRHLAQGLVRRGHEVDVVTSRSLPGLRAEEEMEGVHVHRRPFPSRGPVGWTAHVGLATPRVLALARTADLVHAQAFATIPPGAWARRRYATPLVATFHSSHFLLRAARRRWRPVLRRLVRSPDHAFAASREIAEVAMALAPGTRVEALPNGVDTELFRPLEPALPSEGEGGSRLVVPRRLFPKNGVEYLVRAVPHLLRERPALEVLIVGDGPERARLESLAARLGAAESVHFLGARPHEEMPAVLSSADLAVFPSLMEATSIAALEAMACGLPVAASRVGGLPEIVDDDVGALFRPADPEDLARAVNRLLGGSDLEEKGRRARKRVCERWSNDRLVERHLEVYQELLARRGGHPSGTPPRDGSGAERGAE